MTMKNSNWRALVALSLLFLTGCETQQAESDTCTSCYSSMDVSAWQNLLNQAREGDPKAADQVARYFYFGEKDLRSAIYWERLAAEKGDPDYQANLANFLLLDGPTYNCVEAKSLLKNLVDQGFDSAGSDFEYARKECPD